MGCAESTHETENGAFKIAVTGEKPPIAHIRKIRTQEENLIIPKNVFCAGERFTLIGFVPGAFHNSPVKSISFADDSMIKNLCNNPFRDSMLVSLSLPPNIEKINYSTLDMIETLESITLSPGNKFYEVTKDNKMLIQKSQRKVIFLIRSCKNVIFPENIEIIDEFSMCGCQIESLEIPETVKIIEESSLKSNHNLREISFGKNSVLEEIGKSAFEDCSAITSISLPEYLQHIGKDAFKQCEAMTEIFFHKNSHIKNINGLGFSGIKEIVIPSSCETIDDDAFQFTQQLEILDFAPGSKCKSIGERAFCTSRLMKICIPKSVEIIKNRAFDECALEEITYEDGSNLRIYGDEVFWQCWNLRKCDFPRSVEEIGVRCFAGLIELDVHIPEGSSLKFIKDEAFKECGISHLVLPPSVELMGEGAFSGSKIDEVIIPATCSLNKISPLAFHACTCLRRIEINGSIEEFGASCLSGNHNLEEIIIPENSMLAIFGIKCCENTKLHSFKFPASTKLIDTGAFCDNQSLEEVLFDEESQLETFGFRCFSGCNIKRIKIPKSVKVISNAAFEKNSQLQIVEFEEGSELVTIGAESFSGCNIGDICIPESVTTINDRAFIENENFQKVKLSKGSRLSSVGMWVFPETLSEVEGGDEQARNLIQYS